MNSSRMMIRIAIFLIAVGVSYFMAKKDPAIEDNATQATNFTRSATSSTVEESPDAVIPIAANATQQEVIELHNLALEAVNAKQYQVAYEIMTQLYG
jgi:hypothetical protein